MLCGRTAHFRDERRTCLPCARGQLVKEAALHSWKVKFPAESATAILQNCSGLSLSSIIGVRLHRCRALLKAFHGFIYSEVPDIDITSADNQEQTFVLLRPSSSHDWSCFSFRLFGITIAWPSVAKGSSFLKI